MGTITRHRCCCCCCCFSRFSTIKRVIFLVQSFTARVTSYSAALTAACHQRGVSCNFCWVLPPECFSSVFIARQEEPGALKHASARSLSHCGAAFSAGRGKRKKKGKRNLDYLMKAAWQVVPAFTVGDGVKTKRVKLSLEQLVILSYLRPKRVHSCFVFFFCFLSSSVAFSSPAVGPLQHWLQVELKLRRSAVCMSHIHSGYSERVDVRHTPTRIWHIYSGISLL